MLDLAAVRAQFPGLDPKRARELTAFIKRYDPVFYHARGLGKIHWRARLSTPALLKLLRNFTR